MAIPRMLANMTQYLSEAFMRLFSPVDDAYPIIGIQPFTGDVYKPRRAESW